MSRDKPEPTFAGWLGDDPDSAKGNLRWGTFTPKPFVETDIDIRITHCGICGSDLHTLRSGWAPANYPVCVGHEIIGYAIRVGSRITQNIKLGDRVGVGAQSSSCLDHKNCAECRNGQENYCMRGMVGTYNSKYKDGSKSFGGYGKFARVPAHFVVKIPDGLESSYAAPMLCGGITTYTPLIEHGAGPGTKVGIVGLGGLGHFGTLWAKALGCEVTVISRSRTKESDAIKMGATNFIATGEDPKWSKKYARTLDLIVSTVGDKNLPLNGYLALLKVKGTLIQVGAPEGKIPGFSMWNLIGKGVKLGGSSIGSPSQISEMLEMAARLGVRPWVQEIPMEDANRAIVEFEEGKPRYRYVLVNENKGRL